MKDETKKKIVDREYYIDDSTSNAHHLHTDRSVSVEYDPTIHTIVDTCLMGEKEYNDTIITNSCVSADFAEWYGNSDYKIEIILVKIREDIELYEGE